MAGLAGVLLVAFVVCVAILVWAPMDPQTEASLRVLAWFFLVPFLLIVVSIYSKNRRRLF